MNTMINKIAVIATLLGLASSALAEVPTTLTYSGHLTDGDLPVDGSVDVVFNLFDVEIDGAAVWSETHTTVNVDNGLFTAELGAQTSITPLLTGAVYWLEVSVDGQAMVPRTPFRAVPYARKAAESDAVGGYSASQLMTGATPAGDQVTYDNSTSGLSAANMQAAIDELLARIATLEAQNEAQQTAIETNTGYIKGNSTAIGHNKDNIAINADAIAANSGEILDLQTLTEPMSLTDDEFTFSGVNVNIVSGQGSTDADVNGTGNLVLGYNEARETGSDKSGSHNLVIGPNHNYTSYGGMVVGYQNTISGVSTAISGGGHNEATGDYTSIAAGVSGTASGFGASISGGMNNTASGDYATVTAGTGNTASGHRSTVSGGVFNTAAGLNASVNGGSDNQSLGTASVVSGGYQNTCQPGGFYTWIGGGAESTTEGGDLESVGGAVMGGWYNHAHEIGAAVCGGRDNLASGFYAAVLGGGSNTASGWNASVTGGSGNAASGDDAVIVGGQTNISSGEAAAVIGGAGNTANGQIASILGGAQNTASGFGATVSGGGWNSATAEWASVSAGQTNVASGFGSSVSGGTRNTAAAYFSTISGGYGGELPNTDEAFDYDWLAGDLHEADAPPPPPPAPLAQ